MDLVEITYRDNNNWVSALDGIITDWTNYSKKIKKSRIVPHYIANEFVFDIWNNKEFSIQDKLWESYQFEFELQEFENIELNRLSSCSDIKIKKYSVNSSGQLLEKEYILDTTKSDYINISEPEQLADTTGYKSTITFRTKRTIINKGSSVNNTNNITINSIPYYTDFDVLTWNKENEPLNVEWDSGDLRLFQTLNKEGLQILLYFKNTELESFLSDLDASTTTTINATTITEIEKEIAPIGEDYYKVIIRGVTGTIVKTNDLNSDQLYKLEIIDNTSTTHNFYTDFAPQLGDLAPVISAFTNGGAVQNNTRSITKDSIKVIFYYNKANAKELKKRFELGGTSIKFGLTASYPTVDVVEQWQAVTIGSPIGVDVYRVEIDMIIGTTKSY